MTTSTLELVDWATILDDEPACESIHGCDQAAEFRVVLACGCAKVLCGYHTEAGNRRLAHLIATLGHQWECYWCGAEGTARCLSDIVTVVPL